MTKDKKLVQSFLNGVKRIGDFPIHALSGGRWALLEERESVLVGGAKEGQEVDPFSVYEILFVCTKDWKELVALSMEDEREWKLAVKLFSGDVPDEVINEFWDVLQGEMLERIQEAQTVPAKKPAARKRPRKS